MNSFDELFQSIPIISKVYLFLSTTIMILCSLDIISPYSLYLNWRLVLNNFQFWRLFTCFLYFGNFGFLFFWNSYVLFHYCSSLETSSFHRRSADFLWMLLLTGSMLLVLSYFFGAGYFFSGAMINVMTYLWGKRNPTTRMSILVFNVRAPYLPWVLTCISILMGWRFEDHFMGIIVGHTYYFLEDVYPLMPTSRGFRLFQTPTILNRMFKSQEEMI